MLIRDRIKNVRFLRSLAIKYRNFISNYSYSRGKGNRILRNGIVVNSKIQILGNCNTVELENDSVLVNTNILINGSNNYIKVKRYAYLEVTQLHIEDNNCELIIGERTFIGLSHLAVTEDNSRLEIGSDCMISSHVQIRTGDSHSIFDMEGNRINKARNIIISNKVWLGEGCKILKGVFLGEQTVVSTGAIVTKTFMGNQLIGGIPAKILKKGIRWTPERLNHKFDSL